MNRLFSILMVCALSAAPLLSAEESEKPKEKQEQNTKKKKDKEDSKKGGKKVDEGGGKDDSSAPEKDDQKAGRTTKAVIHAGKEEGKGSKLRLFILSGQSNMVGLREKESFVPTIEKAFPEDELLLVKLSLSGQPIRRWSKDWTPVGEWKPQSARDKPGNNDLYHELMSMVKEALKGRTPDSVSFVWMQGEADAKQGQADNYEQSLIGLINQVRTDTGRPNATAVIGRISDHLMQEKDWVKVREAEESAVQKSQPAEWVDTDDLNGNDNNLHFNPDGYQKLGERFAEKTVSLLQKQ